MRNRDDGRDDPTSYTRVNDKSVTDNREIFNAPHAQDQPENDIDKPLIDSFRSRQTFTSGRRVFPSTT